MGRRLAIIIPTGSTARTSVATSGISTPFGMTVSLLGRSHSCAAASAASSALLVTTALAHSEDRAVSACQLNRVAVALDSERRPETRPGTACSRRAGNIGLVGVWQRRMADVRIEVGHELPHVADLLRLRPHP